MLNADTIELIRERAQLLRQGESERAEDLQRAEHVLQSCRRNRDLCATELSALEETLRANGFPTELVKCSREGEVFPEHPPLTLAQERDAHRLVVSGGVPLLRLNGSVGCVCIAIKEAGYPPVFSNFTPCRSFYVDLHTHSVNRNLMYFEEAPADER